MNLYLTFHYFINLKFYIIFNNNVNYYKYILIIDNSTFLAKIKTILLKKIILNIYIKIYNFINIIYKIIKIYNFINNIYKKFELILFYISKFLFDFIIYLFNKYIIIIFFKIELIYITKILKVNKFNFNILIWISQSYLNLCLFLIPTVILFDMYIFLFMKADIYFYLIQLFHIYLQLFYWLGYNWFGETGIVLSKFILKYLNIINLKLGKYISNQNNFLLILYIFLIVYFFEHLTLMILDYWSLFYLWKYGKFVIFRNFVYDSIFETERLFLINFIFLFLYYGFIKKYSLLLNLLNMFYAYFFYSIYLYNIGWLTYIQEYSESWPTEFYLTQKINYKIETIWIYDQFNLFCPNANINEHIIIGTKLLDFYLYHLIYYKIDLICIYDQFNLFCPMVF
jgi:hypothetical protein